MSGFVSGCVAHNDCFTCPFDDCIAWVGTASRPRPSVSQVQLRRYNAQLAYETKASRRTQRHRLAFLMHEAGRSYSQIAKMFGIPNGTAPDWVKRGRLAAQLMVDTTKAPASAVRRSQGLLLYERG